MAVIVPTITTEDVNACNASLVEFSNFAKRIQLDASDGSFAPTNLAPLSGVQKPADDVALDIHLMSAKPSEHLADILELKPSLCILHAEVDDDLKNIFVQLRNAGVKVGIALLRSTFPGRVRELIELADHVMIFAGDLGRQGGTIDMLQTEKIPLVKDIKFDVEIGWDGGANLSNVRALAHSGVDVINVGSALSRASDPAAMYQSLLAESDKKGVLV